jgi:hypothetical protein
VREDVGCGELNLRAQHFDAGQVRHDRPSQSLGAAIVDRGEECGVELRRRRRGRGALRRGLSHISQLLVVDVVHEARDRAKSQLVRGA